jgi:radical SAM superfamily enzyme YgiQ (UPF0313 family)
MNVLLIFPLNEPYDTIINAKTSPWKSKLNFETKIKKLDCAYPTGLLSIAAYVSQQVPDVNIRILDVNAVMNQVAACKVRAGESLAGYTFEDLHDAALAQVEGFNPDIIGVSTLFCSVYRDLGPLASILKRKYREALLVCGGHLASSVYDRIFKDRLEFDAVGYGEGEIPLAELAQAVKDRKGREHLESSTCWITAKKLKDNSGFVPANMLITNLDEIPPFDLGLLVSPEAYFNSSKYFFVIETDKTKKEIFYFSTRGCPYHCVFCASQNVHGHKVRSYSVDRVKQDILHYHAKYGVTRFVFYDDHFLVYKKRAMEILNFITEHNLNAEIPTPAFFSLDKEVAATMRRAGIREVNITIESGNEHTLKHIMHKPANLKKAEEAVEYLHAEGIMAVANILIGLPGETKEAIDKGLQWLLTTKINWFQCFVTAPLPGSELYEICKKNGYLVNDSDIMTMDYKKCIIQTDDFTPEYIEKKAYEMNLMLNFVNNYDYREGNYEGALKLFERVITAVIDTHAFAYYFAAKCCKKLGLDEKYQNYKSKYGAMTEKYPFWNDYVAQFELKPLE